jgi:hypothetical protein
MREQVHFGELIVAQEEGTANSVPAAAVIQRSQVLFGIIGRKGCAGCCESPRLKNQAQPDSSRGNCVTRDLEGIAGIHSVAVKCVDIVRKTNGEGRYLESIRRSCTKAKGANGIRYPGSLGCKRCALGVAFFAAPELTR